jgi:hypothetical protein
MFKDLSNLSFIYAPFVVEKRLVGEYHIVGSVLPVERLKNLSFFGYNMRNTVLGTNSVVIVPSSS